MKFVKLYGEAASAPDSEVARARDLIDDLVRRYNPNCIYNMDEAGLFWQMEPDKSLVTSEEGDVRGVKRAKARITIAVCSNLTGRDKVKLWVIGKNKNPRSFKKWKVENYVQWSWNQKAWMTSENFNEYLEWFDKHVAKKHGERVVLLLDNCPAHKMEVTLKYTNVVFLPPNVTSIV